MANPIAAAIRRSQQNKERRKTNEVVYANLIRAASVRQL